MKGYSARDVATMLGLSPAQVRSYVSNGFLQPARGPRGEYHFTFHDLVLLRTARELIDANVPKRKITIALKNLQRQLPHGQPLTAVRIAALDDQVVVRDGETMWSPDSGQILFDFSIADLAQKVRPFAARKAAAARQSDRSADEWFELGVELEIGAPDDALGAYAAAVALDASHAEAQINYGRMLYDRKEYAAAERAYRAAIAADPEQPTAHYNLAILLEDTQRMEEAIGAYREALRIDPEFADAHYNLAGVYEQLGRTPLAIRHLKYYKKLIES